MRLLQRGVLQFPYPLWGGVRACPGLYPGGGGKSDTGRSAIPLSPTLPHKRGGSRRVTLGNWLRCAAVGFVLAQLIAPTAAQTKKPRVPIGIDPGGVMVAIATDTGIDYTQKDIAGRLARDGEGELIGWDFVDNDRQPYAPAATSAAATELARALLAEAPGTRLAVFRAKPGDKIALGRLAVYAAQSRNRILLVTTSSSTYADWEAFAEAVAHFKELLVIAPAEAGQQAFPAALGLANVLSVSTTPKAEPSAPAPAIQPDVHIPARSDGKAVAVARIAALAARLSVSAPGLDGASLKQRVVILTSPGSMPPAMAPAPTPLTLPPAAPR